MKPKGKKGNGYWERRKRDDDYEEGKRNIIYVEREFSICDSKGEVRPEVDLMYVAEQNRRELSPVRVSLERWQPNGRE